MFRAWYSIIAAVAVCLIAQPVWAAITVGNTTTSAGTGTTNVPSGTVNGDLMIASCNAATSNIAPTGWTNLDREAVSTPSLSTAYRVASSEPANYQFAGLAGTSFCSITDYHGTSATPIDAHGINNAHDTAPTAPSLAATAVSGEWEFVVYVHCQTFTGPGGETNRGLNASCASQYGYWSGDSNASLGGSGTSVPAVAGTLAPANDWGASSITFEPSAVVAGQKGLVVVVP